MNAGRTVLGKPEGMTYEEKMERIDDFCQDQRDCSTCPLLKTKQIKGICASNVKYVIDESIKIVDNPPIFVQLEIHGDFRDDFEKDRFKECMGRICADIEHGVKSGGTLAGRYEKETCEMLAKAFKEAKVIE